MYFTCLSTHFISHNSFNFVQFIKCDVLQWEEISLAALYRAFQGVVQADCQSAILGSEVQWKNCLAIIAEFKHLKNQNSNKQPFLDHGLLFLYYTFVL